MVGRRSLLLGVLSLAAAAAAAPPAQLRRAVQWLVPYGNLTTASQYEAIWAQLKEHHRPAQNLYAASAYALKENNASLGYATTPAGEASYGLQMETLGMPALRAMGLGGEALLGMVYVTHTDAIARMLANPTAFIAQLVAKVEEQQLGGVDLDYEPQAVAAAERANAAKGLGSAASFMQFIERLAAALAAKGAIVTIDISGCPSSYGFDCAGAANASFIPGLALVNTEDAFGAGSLDDLKSLQQTDGTAAALGARWAPGWEPNNIGPAAFAAALQYLASPAACKAAGGICPMAISMFLLAPAAPNEPALTLSHSPPTLGRHVGDEGVEHGAAGGVALRHHRRLPRRAAARRGGVRGARTAVK